MPLPGGARRDLQAQTRQPHRRCAKKAPSPTLALKGCHSSRSREPSMWSERKRATVPTDPARVAVHWPAGTAEGRSRNTRLSQRHVLDLEQYAARVHAREAQLPLCRLTPLRTHQRVPEPPGGEAFVCGRPFRRIFDSLTRLGSQKQPSCAAAAAVPAADRQQQQRQQHITIGDATAAPATALLVQIPS